MSLKRWASIVLICTTTMAVAGPVAAQATKVHKIRDLLEITQTETLVRAILPPMRHEMTLIISRVHPHIPDPVWDEVYDEAEMALRKSLDHMIESSIPIYARNLTEEEIDGLLVFYRTEVGRSVVAKMPQILQESMTSNRQQIHAAGEEVQRHIFEKLADAGYKM